MALRLVPFVAVLACLARPALGCGGRTELGGGTGAPHDAGSEAAQPAGTCDLSAPFQAPAPVLGINTPSLEAAIFLSPDELTAYFTSDRAAPNEIDIFVAHRTSKDGAFSAAQLVDGVGPQATRASVTGDQRDLVYESGLCPGAQGTSLCEATRSNDASPFSPGLAIDTQVTWPGFIGSPYMLADGLTIFVAVASPPPNAIGVAHRPSVGGGFGPIAKVPIDGPDAGFVAMGTPVVTPDERTIFFGAVINGEYGGMWQAARADTSGAFTDAQRIDFHYDHLEWPNWISPDGCRLYFERELPPQWDVYVATRPPK